MWGEGGSGGGQGVIATGAVAANAGTGVAGGGRQTRAEGRGGKEAGCVVRRNRWF